MRLLTTPLALVSLFLLALNDHYLKATYHNALTGKLSDVAGVLLLPLFLKAALRCGDRAAVWTTVGFFIWWKSSFSQGVIDAWNTLDLFTVGRIIDYTDLLALSGLPLSYWVLQRERTPARISIPRIAVGRYLAFPLCLLTLVATSLDDDLFVPDGSVTECCLDTPLNQAVAGGRVLAPTAFTPDGDGLNDTFYIAATAGVTRIESLIVRDFTTGDTVFFNPLITEFTAASGWDGRVRDTVRSATFDYFFTATSETGQPIVLGGYVCSLPCPAEGMPTAEAARATCVFASQLTAGGTFDLERDSAEELSCY